VGNEAESIRGEAGALVELELLQHVAPGTDELSEVVVRDDHAAEVERLEALERRGELGDPGAGVGAPVVGNLKPPTRLVLFWTQLLGRTWPRGASPSRPATRAAGTARAGAPGTRRSRRAP